MKTSSIKILFTALILIMALFVSGFSPVGWVTGAIDIFKEGLEGELEAALGRKVAVGSIKGLNVYQIELQDLSADDLRAKRVLINYNPAKLALSKGNIMASITNITLFEPDIYITREKTGKISFFDIAPANGAGREEFKTDLSARINIVGGRVHFNDHMGFKSEARDAPFRSTFTDISGHINLERLPDIFFDLKAMTNSGGVSSTVHSSGKISPHLKRFYIDISAERLNLAAWGNYFSNIPDLSFKGGFAAARIRLSAPPRQAGHLPVDISGSISIFNGSAEYREQKIERASGSIRTRDRTILLENWRASVSGSPVSASGYMENMGEGNINIDISSRATPLKNIADAAPFLDRLGIEGTADTNTKISGTRTAPKVASEILFAEGSVLSNRISGAVSLTFENGLFEAVLKSSEFLSGTVFGKCSVDLNADTPYFVAAGGIESADMGDVSPLITGTSGLFSGTFEAKGRADDFDMRGLLMFHDAMLFGRSADKGSIIIKGKDNIIDVSEVRVVGKDLLISASGEVKDGLAGLKTKIEGVLLSGVLPRTIIAPAQASVTVESFEGEIFFDTGRDIAKEPLKTISVDGNVKLTGINIGPQIFDAAEGGIKFGEGSLELKEFILTIGDSEMVLDGYMGTEAPTNLSVSGRNVDLKRIKLINEFLPEYAQDPEGTADFQFVFDGAPPKDAGFSLLDLNARGTMILREGKFAGEDISSAEADIVWKDKALAINALRIKTPLSELSCSGKKEPDGSVDVSISGTLDLLDTRPFTAKYAKMSGKVDLKAEIKGSVAGPEIEFDYLANNFQFGEIKIDMTAGKLLYKDRTIILKRPVAVYQKGDIYRVSGGIEFRDNGPEFDVQIDAVRGDLQTATLLAETLNKEFLTKEPFLAVREKLSVRIDTAAMLLPHISGFKDEHGRYTLYFADGGEQPPLYFLQDFDQLASEVRSLEEEDAIQARNIGGVLEGTITLKGTPGNIEGSYKGTVRNGHIEDYKFDEIYVSGSFEEGKTSIDELALKKNGGRASATGVIRNAEKLALAMSAKDLPIDFMNLLLKTKKPLEGKVNGSAAFSGKIGSLEGRASFVVSNGDIADVKFRELIGEIKLINNSLFVDTLKMIGPDHNEIADMSGKISFSKDGEIGLAVNLKEEGIGLLSLPAEDLRFIRGRGEAAVSVKGYREDIDMNGTIRITSAVFYLPGINSYIDRTEAEVDIRKSRASIGSFKAVLIGDITGGMENPLDITGEIDLAGALKESGASIELSIAQSDAVYHINSPGLYVGRVKLENISLSGPLSIAEEKKEMPLLQGKITLKKGRFFYAEPKTGDISLPIALGLTMDIGEDLFIVGGDMENLIAPDLSNIILNLEAEGKDISVGGTAGEPSLLGEITFKRGSINILNRDFFLLSTTDQRDLLKEVPENIKENTAVFEGTKGIEGSIPNISLVSQVKVKGYIEETESALPGEPTIIRQENFVVVARMNGMPFVTDRERSIKVKLDAYIEDAEKRPAELSHAGLSDEDTKILLLPDYIKTPLAQKKGGLEGVTARAVLTDYLNSRLQVILLRGVERELERTLGLERLTLEYNFGKDIEKLFPGETPVSPHEFAGARETVFGVGAGKGFFDRLFIDVRYAQSLEEQETRAYSNYQITYKLTSIWSFIYYKEPLFPEMGYPYYQVTLKAGFRF